MQLYNLGDPVLIMIFMSKHIRFQYFFCEKKLSKPDMFAHKNRTGSPKLYTHINTLTILVDMCGKIMTVGQTDLSEYALLETH